MLCLMPADKLSIYVHKYVGQCAQSVWVEVQILHKSVPETQYKVPKAYNVCVCVLYECVCSPLQQKVCIICKLFLSVPAVLAYLQPQ